MDLSIISSIEWRDAKKVFSQVMSEMKVKIENSESRGFWLSILAFFSPSVRRSLEEEERRRYLQKSGSLE